MNLEKKCRFKKVLEKFYQKCNFIRLKNMQKIISFHSLAI